MKLLGCVVLATLAPTVLQATPQRVERLSRLEWCDDPSEWCLQQYSATQVEGSRIFSEETTPLWRRLKPEVPSATFPGPD